MIIWFTGQPGSGKTTLAMRLWAYDIVDFVVDGDQLRTLLPNPGYDETGRRQNIDRAQAIAAYFNSEEFNVAVALVAPYRDQRESFKDLHDVIEVYLTKDDDDVRGREQYHVEDYQPPADDCITINTTHYTVAEAAAFLLSEAGL